MWFSEGLALFTSLLLGLTFQNNVRSHAQAQSTILNQAFHPVGIALGNRTSTDTAGPGVLSLNSSFPIATLDYGREVAGYPIFEVGSVSGIVQLEIKYAEEFHALEENLSDGPLPYAVGLSNTYRVETIEVGTPGSFSSFMLQGGQRWQSIRLLTEGAITFSSVGLDASVAITDANDLPGGFECDNESLNEIWKLGARAAGMACVEKGSQKRIWQVDSSGAFVRGMRAGLSAKAWNFENYTLEFDAKIERAGLGWAVAHPLASPAKGIQLNVVGNLPSNTTFVNTNTSFTPPNSILLAYGYSFVNVTTLTSYYLDTFSVPFDVEENTWYRIKTILAGGEYLSVSIGETLIFNVSMNDYYVGASPYPGLAATIPLRGSFGFGGWQDQSGLIKNVVVSDSSNQSVLYQNPMVDESQVVAEFGVHENYASVCLDGPKRDRLVWLGDFLHTTRIIGASTSRMDMVRGTLNFLLDWQIPSGLLPYAPPMGYNASVASDAFSIGGGGYLEGLEVAGIILPDYQILGLIAFADYVALSNDLAFAEQTWAAWKLNMDWILKQINSTTGLLTLNGGFLGPSSQGSAINCALVEALVAMADVALALGDEDTQQQYVAVANSLKTSINELLWNESLGVYILSSSSLNDFSVNSIAFCITSGTANATRAQRSILAVSALRAGPGYKDDTTVNASLASTNISPNTNGFLLRALLSSSGDDYSGQGNNASRVSLDLLQSLWGEMLNDEATTTGASWEYVNLEGNPGLGLFTSLSHPWGGSPTYLLTQWAAGVQPAKGVDGFGYKSWSLQPRAGVEMGLTKAKARVSTAFGRLEAEWELVNSTIQVRITAPLNTTGHFQIGNVTRELSGASNYSFECKVPPMV